MRFEIISVNFSEAVMFIPTHLVKCRLLVAAIIFHDDELYIDGWHLPMGRRTSFARTT